MKKIIGVFILLTSLAYGEGFLLLEIIQKRGKIRNSKTRDGIKMGENKRAR